MGVSFYIYTGTSILIIVDVTNMHIYTHCRMAPMMLLSIILGHYVIQDCWGMPYTYWDGGMRKIRLHKYFLYLFSTILLELLD